MHGFEEDAGRVVRVLPEHDAAELMLGDVGAFGSERLRIFVGNKDVALRIIEVRCGGFRVPVTNKASGEKVGKVGIGEVNSPSGFTGLKEAVVFIGDFTPAAAIERNAENNLAFGNAGLHVLGYRAVSGNVLRVGGVSEERSVVTGAGSAHIKVVGHEVDGVDVPLDLIHLGVLEEFAGSTGSDGDIEPAMQPSLFAVEALAKFGEQQGVVLFVLGTEGVAIPRLIWILPVDVQPVEFVPLDEADGAVNEACTRARGEGGIGESSRTRSSRQRRRAA